MMLRLRSPKAQRLRCVGNLPFVMKVVFFFLTKKGKKDISFMCESAGIYTSNTDMCLSILYLECIYVYIYTVCTGYALRYQPTNLKKQHHRFILFELERKNGLFTKTKR